MVGDASVAFCVDRIQYDEQQIETGQQRVLESDVLHRRLVLIVLYDGNRVSTYRML